MGACVPCCKCIAFFGIIFYVFMGIIVLAQNQFLKFDTPNKTDSGVACFIVAIIQLIILVGLIFFQKWQNRQNISRQNYVNLESERSQRPRQSSFKGIAMGDLRLIRQQRQKQERQRARQQQSQPPLV